MESGISSVDWFALTLYLLGITVIGVWTARKVKDSADFFMGGRRFGKAFMVFFAFGAGTNGNQAVTVASKTYTNGLSGIWYQWLWLFATPFYWVIAPIFRRMRALTTGDYFDFRYGPATAGLYTLVGVLQLSVFIGVMLLGSSAVIEAVSGGQIDRVWGIFGITVLFVIYGVAGGLNAAIVTDFIQGILTVLFSFMLLPFALKAVGGFAGLHASIEQESMFSLVAPGEINLFHIIIFSFNALIGIVTQPHIMGVCGAGKTELDGSVGIAGGNLLKRVCTVAWVLTGLCGVVLYKNLTGTDVDQVYGKMAAELLPQILPGLVGIFIAALLASIMSSCDAFMVASSGLFTENFYKRFLVPDREESHYVTVGRIASVFIVAGSILFAFKTKTTPEGLETFLKLQAMMGAAFWVGLFWRRATPAGAWAGTLVAFAIMVITGQDFFHTLAAEHFPKFMIWDEKFRVSFQMLFYLIGGFGTCIVVSFFTQPVPKERLDRFYNCLRTPVESEEPHLAPFTLPEGTEPGKPRKVIDKPNWELYVPSRRDILGFAGFWACVFIMIWFVRQMAQWGA